MLVTTFVAGISMGTQSPDYNSWLDLHKDIEECMKIAYSTGRYLVGLAIMTACAKSFKENFRPNWMDKTIFSAFSVFLDQIGVPYRTHLFGEHITVQDFMNHWHKNFTEIEYRCSGNSLIDTLSKSKLTYIREDIKAITNAWFDGNSSIMVAAVERGDIGIIKSLIDKGAELSKRNQEGVTPLECAVRGMKACAVATLLDGGANPNESGENLLYITLPRKGKWFSPTHCNCEDKIFSALLSNGADPNSRDQSEERNYIIERMCYVNRINDVENLIKHGCDLSIIKEGTYLEYRTLSRPILKLLHAADCIVRQTNTKLRNHIRLSLSKSCRKAIRKQMSEPFFLQRISKLPLPRKLQLYLSLNYSL